MRRTVVIAVAALAVMPAIALAQGGHSHTKAKPKYGGVVTEVNEIDYELVAKADSIRLYLSDHDKPVNVANASAKVTLLTGSEKSEATLKPAGDKLEASGTFKVGPGTKAVAIVTLPGKPAQSVRFDIK
jgi:hypothetical protein